MRAPKVIYFSGPDGSGKTTTFLHMTSLLQEAGFSTFQLRTLQVCRLSCINKKKSHTDSDLLQQTSSFGVVGKLGYSSLKRDRGNGVLFQLRRYIGLLAAILDISIMGRFFIREKSLNYDYILVEECPFDVFAKRHRPYFRFTSNILKFLIPLPDLLIFCVASPHEINARKPELTELEIKHYYYVMEKIYSGLKGLNVFRHNTNSSTSPFELLDQYFFNRIN